MDVNKPAKGGQGGLKTKANGGGTQVMTQKQQIQQQQKQQKKPIPKKVPNKPPAAKQKGGVRIDAEVNDDLNIQNEQNEKWQCEKCKYVNENIDTECQKCIHLQKLKEQQNKQ